MVGKWLFRKADLGTWLRGRMLCRRMVDEWFARVAKERHETAARDDYVTLDEFEKSLRS